MTDDRPDYTDEVKGDVNPKTGTLYHAYKSTEVVRTGTWTTSGDVRAFEGLNVISNTTDDTIELPYTGTSVWIRFRLDGDSGIAEISMDDDVQTTVDLFSASIGYVMPIFGITNTLGSHTIKIRVTGTKNASSTGYYVKVNGFVADSGLGLAQVLSMSEETVQTYSAGNVLDADTVDGEHAAAFLHVPVTFSLGGTILDPTAARNVPVWRAPIACTVTNVRGYRVGGTGATINARHNGTDNHLATALSLTSADTWTNGGTVQNTAYTMSDKLEIMLVTVTGAPTEIGIQVDFTRP